MTPLLPVILLCMFLAISNRCESNELQNIASRQSCLTQTTSPPTSTAPSQNPTTYSLTSSSVTASSISCVPFLEINAGSAQDRKDLIVGKSDIYPFPALAVTDAQDKEIRFSSHRYGTDFLYSIPVDAGQYTVSLGFAEIWPPNCVTGKRIFSVRVNSVEIPYLNFFDTYKEAGACNTPVVRTVLIDVPEITKKIEVRFIAAVDKAFISDIRVFRGNLATAGNCLATSQPTTTIQQTSTTQAMQITTTGPAVQSTIKGNGPLSSLQIACGLTDAYVSDKTKTSLYVIPTSTDIYNTVDDAKYRAHRYGKDFTYLLPMEPGSYQITLGFAETYAANCHDGKRIFAVVINGKEVPELKNFDPYKEAAACNSAVFKVTTAEVTTFSGPLSVTFKAITENAFISTIEVKKSVVQCIPVSNAGLTTENHRAHAVPGGYPPQLNADSPKAYIDNDGDGFERVTIDGTKSHSHFQDVSDPENPITGEITKYKWTNVGTGEIISNSPSFSALFPLGTTRLHLMVTDNTCDVAEAETSVTVTGSVQPGRAYCYYYETSTLPDSGGAASSTIKPFYAAERAGFHGILESPPGKESSVFSVRCTLFYEVTEDILASLAINTEGTGKARLIKGTENILDNSMAASVETKLLTGLSEFEVLYVREDATRSPTLSITVNGNPISPSKISFDRNTVLPVLAGVSPSKSPPAGGVRLRISGYGFYIQPDLIFGESELVKADTTDWTPSVIYVTAPAFAPGKVFLKASTTKGGVSNSLTFEYEGANMEPVKFSRAIVQKPNKTPFSVVATCIAVWGDSWYLGLFGGKVMKLTVDTTLTVTSQCTTAALTDSTFLAPNSTIPANVDVLGIAFSPLDTIGRPYVTVNTLFWFDRDVVDESNRAAWRNGRIERLKPGGGCLVPDERIVSGLPV